MSREFAGPATGRRGFIPASRDAPVPAACPTTLAAASWLRRFPRNRHPEARLASVPGFARIAPLLLALALVGRAGATAADPAPRDTLDLTVATDTPADPVARLRARRLAIPVDGVEPAALRDDFDAPRSGGRRHQALDILAPRGTPVRAVEDGTILGVDPDNGSGGIVVREVDAEGGFVYGYAHLDRWADWIRSGVEVFRGQVLGYVGSTGNATTPHLHFTITPMAPDGRPGRGSRINPFLVFR